MQTFMMRCKSGAIATMIIASGFCGTSQVKAVSAKQAVAVTAIVATLATWVRLNSKGSKWDYTTENWREDFEEFLNSLNVFDAESRATLLRLFDKWVVGRQLSIIDISYKTKDGSGVETTRKEKFVKTKPFGLMGLFDAYVLFQLKKIDEHTENAQCLLTILLLAQIASK